MVNEREAFNWAKRIKKTYVWFKADTQFKDLTTAKKAILVKAYTKSQLKGTKEAAATMAKAEKSRKKAWSKLSPAEKKKEWDKYNATQKPSTKLVAKLTDKSRQNLRKKQEAEAKPKAKGRNYQYVIYLPEDYSDSEALDYWSKSKLVSSKSGVELTKSLTTENDRPIYDKGTYHVFTAKKHYTIKEWKLATKGRPSGFVSETGKNYGYTGGITKKVRK
jgi:hypothetical protein